MTTKQSFLGGPPHPLRGGGAQGDHFWEVNFGAKNFFCIPRINNPVGAHLVGTQGGGGRTNPPPRSNIINKKKPLPLKQTVKGHLQSNQLILQLLQLRSAALREADCL